LIEDVREFEPMVDFHEEVPYLGLIDICLLSFGYRAFDAP
jgi:hypothetical protein